MHLILALIIKKNRYNLVVGGTCIKNFMKKSDYMYPPAGGVGVHVGTVYRL